VIPITRSSNEVIFSVIPELEELKQITQPKPAEQLRITLLEKKLEITKSDKNGFVRLLGLTAGIGVVLMICGFIKWHTGLQRVLDRTANVQLEIAELQLAKLRKEFEDQQKSAAVRSGIEPIETPNI
jgi:hypothetical protein